MKKPHAKRLRHLSALTALAVVLIVWLHYGKDGVETLAAAIGSWAGLNHLAHDYFRGK